MEITEGFLNPLVKIEEFVHRAIESNDPIYNFGIIDPYDPEVGLSELGQAIIPFFSSMAECYDTRFDYSEYVNAFFQSLTTQYKNFNLSYGGLLLDIPGEVRTEFFNGLVTKIRETCSTKDFARKIVLRRFKSKENYNRALDFIEALFKKTSRILVLRVDFGYRAAVRGEINEISAAKHRDDFLNNTRSNAVFKNLLGYIWKFEYGKTKGHHYHFAFFYDGARVWKDSFRADQIGKCWEKITRGWGTYYNCNRSKCKYKYIGIGMINHDDIEMRENLKKAVSYLTKKDQYLRKRLSKKMKTFQTSNFPKFSDSRVGRPRRSIDSASPDVGIKY